MCPAYAGPGALGEPTNRRRDYANHLRQFRGQLFFSGALYYAAKVHYVGEFFNFFYNFNRIVYSMPLTFLLFSAESTLNKLFINSLPPAVIYIYWLLPQRLPVAKTRNKYLF
ncbi:hypothetical protein D1627_02475 [Pontibacter oryzae]|uniref:Uncharacterized protein n=1 Tax=Pontibacter oryzae TaxID=2304593 RepID=A0A399SKL7_9BACT|nr:hypothetical protein D1627_02475 [Pontibacter oryzae]